jgi:DNA polymerase/3'-5' exonuclease PolX
MVQYNSKIISEFEKLIIKIQYDIDNNINEEHKNNIFRLRSISKSLKIIKKYNKNIKTENDLIKLKKINGIGFGTIDRIKEIFKYGKLKEIDINIQFKQEQLIKELIKVFGIGRTNAQQLLKKYKIKNIDDLYIFFKNVKTNKIKVNNMIKVGITYYNDLKQKIPRNQITYIYKYLKTKIKIHNTNLHIIICGSYRREKLISGDIDILVVNKIKFSSTDLENLVLFLIKQKFIIASLTKINVNTRYMGICKFKNKIHKIDIRYISIKSYYPALLYFTGSKDHNKMMRQVAISMGYKLNEYGLFNTKTQKFIKVNSEKDIFDKLKLEYINPNER